MQVNETSTKANHNLSKECTEQKRGKLHQGQHCHDKWWDQARRKEAFGRRKGVKHPYRDVKAHLSKKARVRERIQEEVHFPLHITKTLDTTAQYPSTTEVVPARYMRLIWQMTRPRCSRPKGCRKRLQRKNLRVRGQSSSETMRSGYSTKA